jgi:hypothetical protein
MSLYFAYRFASVIVRGVNTKKDRDSILEGSSDLTI